MFLNTVAKSHKCQPPKATPIPATPIEALPRSFIVPRTVPFAKTILNKPTRPYILDIGPKEMHNRIYASLGQAEVSFIQDSPLKSFAIALVAGIILGRLAHKVF